MTPLPPTVERVAYNRAARAISSVGRAAALHAVGRRFESVIAHQAFSSRWLQRMPFGMLQDRHGRRGRVPTAGPAPPASRSRRARRGRAPPAPRPPRASPWRVEERREEPSTVWCGLRASACASDQACAPSSSTNATRVPTNLHIVHTPVTAPSHRRVSVCGARLGASASALACGSRSRGIPRGAARASCHVSPGWGLFTLPVLSSGLQLSREQFELTEHLLPKQRGNVADRQSAA